MKSAQTIWMCATILGLTACGSGGGAILPPGPNSPIVSQAAGTTMTYAADVAEGATAGSSSNLTFAGAQSAAAGAGNTVTVTTDGNGNLLSATVNVTTTGPALSGEFSIYANGPGPYLYGSNGADVPLRGQSLEQIANQFGLVVGCGYDGCNGAGTAGTLFIQTGAQSQLLNYSAYGLWDFNVGTGSLIPGNPANGDFGAFAFGSQTPTASIPQSGSATFNGTTIGMAVSPPTGIMALIGDAQVTANFGAGTVSTAFSNLMTQQIGATTTGTLANLNGTSTIAGNGYSGSLAGGALSGTLNGHFYGPAAQETAGTWNVSGGGLTAIGAFGAR